MKKILALAILACAGFAEAQATFGPPGGGTSTIGPTTPTSGCVAGGVLRSISNMVECGAGLTYDGTTFSVTGNSLFQPTAIGATPLKARAFSTAQTADIFRVEASTGNPIFQVGSLRYTGDAKGYLQLNDWDGNRQFRLIGDSGSYTAGAFGVIEHALDGNTYAQPIIRFYSGNALTGSGYAMMDLGSTASGATIYAKAGTSQPGLTVNGQTSTGNILNLQDNGSNVFTVADGGNVTVSAGTLSVAGVGAGSERFGAGAAADAQSVAVGAGANANSAGGGYCVAVGASSVCTGGSGVALGVYASSTHAHSTALGERAATSAANQLVLGQVTNASYHTTDFVLAGNQTENGVASPLLRLRTPTALGTNIAGTSLDIELGPATGNAAGGALNFKTSDVGSSGATVQTLTTKVSVPVTGGIKLSNGTKPTCDSSTRGTQFYVAGGAGVADTMEVCRKDNSDVYAWVSVF